MKRAAWDSIRDFLYSYQELFLGSPYNIQPHKSVVSWFRDYQRPAIETIGKRGFPESLTSQRSKKAHFDNIPSGQDAATTVSFSQTGWIRLAPFVNRARYIGKNGIHMHSGYWDRMEFGHVNLDVMENDVNTTEFEVV